MKAHHIFAVVTAFCIFNMASASEGEVDRERMQQDLDIMEGILQSLHAQTTSNLAGIHREPQIRGLYFENYGVIFHIEEKRSSGMVVDVDVRRLREKPAGVTEELEEEDAEDYLGWLSGEVVSVDHVPDQVLADPVRDAVCVRESMPTKDRVVSPWRQPALQPAKVDALPFAGEPPPSVVRIRYSCAWCSLSARGS